MARRESLGSQHAAVALLLQIVASTELQALSRPTNATLGGISALAEFVVVYVADAVTTTTPGTTPVSLDKCAWWTVDVLKAILVPNAVRGNKWRVGYVFGRSGRGP